MAVKRSYRINLRNYGNPPAIMLSQYDENYALVFEVFDGALPAASLTSYTVKLKGRQPGSDNPALAYEFTGTISGTLGNVLSFTIDTTMTARAGKGTAEIVIIDSSNDVKFATFNLPVYIEKAAVPDNAIDADVERAQEIADQVQDIVDTAAATVGAEAEAWAVGQRDGVDVPSTDPAYENNAKFYAEQAAQIAEDISGVTDQVATNTSDISDLKEDLNSIVGDFKTLDQFPQTVGIINSTGVWVYTSNNNYKHVVVPVTGGESVTITGNSAYNTYIAFLKTYSAPVSGSADFSEATGFTGRIQLAKGGSYSYTAPSDATYMYILMLENEHNTMPSALVIGGVDYFKSYSDMIEETVDKANADNIKVDALESAVSGLDYKPIEAYPETYGMIKADGTWGNIVSTYTHRAIPVKGGDRIEIIGNADYNSVIALLKSYSVVNGTNADFSASYQSRIQIAKSGHRFWDVPSDATYLFVQVKLGGDDTTPIKIRINNVDITHGLTTNLEELYSPDTVRWCVMGDSIPNGYHSEAGDTSEGDEGEETSETVRWRTWAYLVATWNHWQIDNIAIGGSGYLLTRNGESGYTLGRSVDFTKYNLVTIAYGINDWKGNQVMGDITDDPTGITPTTVIGAIKATIEGILASNPNIKIIVITPLNCYGYNHDYGTESTNWALGYEFSNSGTLESFVQKLIEVCNYYGIQYIDMTHYSPINRKNLPTMVPDGVHPSLACHNLIAHQLSKQITF
ncbi:MAG: SGNH/GDSL hydrolase family protein [Kiritimatiellae bacterium]|nr:SGNH/GDSL hydrolase family protein [Kiritimatiellia bacterium]